MHMQGPAARACSIATSSGRFSSFALSVMSGSVPTLDEAWPLELPASRPDVGASSVACTFVAMHIEWHPLGNVSSARRAESAAASKRLTSELRRCGVSLK